MVYNLGESFRTKEGEIRGLIRKEERLLGNGDERERFEVSARRGKGYSIH